MSKKIQKQRVVILFFLNYVKFIMREEYVWTDKKVDHILALDRRRTGRQLSNILDYMATVMKKLPTFLSKEKKIKESLEIVYTDLKNLELDLSVTK